MSTANNSVPGMMYPTQKAMIGSNPSDSARLSALNKSAAQAQANQLMAGGKIRKSRYGGGNIAVPQYQMLYEPQGGNGSGPNNIIQSTSQTSTQMNANQAFDHNASKMGGSRSGGSKRRRGGNPDWVWGCMSGGKKRTRKSRRKSSRKSRRNRKSRKH